MTLQIRRARTRFRTVAGGRETWHSFSFGAHYDPQNVRFGPLVAHHEERLSPSAGYATHGHRGVELVTWVLEGALVHEDSSGAREVLPAGTVQVHSTGSGIEHSERAGPGPGATRLLQAWLTADDEDSPPVRRVLRAPDVLRVAAGAAFAPVVSGSLDAPLGLGVAGVTLWAAAAPAGSIVAAPGTLPEDARCHLFLATGAARLLPAGVPLAVGDAVRLAAGDAVRLVGESGWSVAPTEPTLLLAWTFR